MMVLENENEGNILASCSLMTENSLRKLYKDESS